MDGVVKIGVGGVVELDTHPLKRLGEPDDLAALVAFLLSDESKFMTGQILRPDGGLSALRLF